MPRFSLAALLLTSTLAACSGAPPPAPSKVPTSPLCDGAHLDACERKLLAPVADAGIPSRALAIAYAEARAARSPDDAWAKLVRELARTPDEKGAASPQAVLVAEGPLPAAAKKLGAATRVLSVPALPTPAAIGTDALLLTLAGALGYRHVIHLRPAPAETTQLFPGDPLSPFVAGLSPIALNGSALDRLADDISMAAAIRASFEAASHGRYIDAAHEADTLTALVEGRDEDHEPVLRAREALQILNNAGLVLDAVGSDEHTRAAPPMPVDARASDPSAPGTPYGDMLRVLTSKDSRKAWAARSKRILGGIAEDRRDDMVAIYTRAHDCQSVGRPVPMESPRDLIFANKLSSSLIHDKATEAQGTAAGLLPLPAWLARYENELRFVHALKLEWAYAPNLLFQRGEAFGLSPAGTPTYKQVTELGLAHLAATRALVTSAKARYRPFSQLALVYSPGVMGDLPLRDALIKLTQETAQDKMGTANNAMVVYGALLTGVFAGLSYPPALQRAHYEALQAGFAAKLHGDLERQTGWGVAGLFVIDAVYRIVADQGPRLDYAASHVARALGDPQVPLPALAALAAASAQYAALAHGGKLDPTLLTSARFPAERRAARDALRSALAGLGDPGEAPNNVLDDVTDLSDGLIATLSSALRASSDAKAPSAVVCASKAPVTLTPTTRKTLGKLGDLRQRIVSHPRFKTGDGRWVRRVRLVVTLLSDAMDIALKENKRLHFSIPTADAEKAMRGALREWDAREAADAIAGLYALGREISTADSPSKFMKTSGQHLRRVIAGLIAYLRNDPSSPDQKGPAIGVALLDAITTLGLDRLGEADIHAMMLSYAKAFYAQGKPDQGDLWLLSTILISAATELPPSQDTLALAAANKSRIEWALRFLAEVDRGRREDAPNPAVYAAAMRSATDDACQVAGAGETISVMQAIHDFATGKRAEARAALDGVLARADREGLGVPRMTYRYEEKTATRVFAATLEVSYGAGVLNNANNFQIGLGLRSRAAPEGALTASLSPPDSAKANEEAARYYVHTAALTAIYHLLEGDRARGTAAARQAIGTLTSGVRLGPRLLRSEKPAAWGADSRALLAVAAVLAADQGMPFLAGDLLTVLRLGLAEDATDVKIAEILNDLPLSLGSVKDLKPIVERARKALQVLAEPLQCTTAKVELGGFEEPSCDAYPLALSLRIADALKKLPRLHRGETGPHCASLRSLDGFLASTEKGAYDPDAFTRAMEDLRAEGSLYDAAALLTRQRRDDHCNPAILSASRTLGRAAPLGPSLRADLLSVAINCAVAGGGDDLERDLLAVDDETRTLPDPERNLKVLLSVADLASRMNQWGLLTKLVDRPEFWQRWMSIHPRAATATLLIAHAVPTINGAAPNLEKTKGGYSLLCEIFPPGDRAELCGLIKGLRAPLLGPMAVRQQEARDAIKKVLVSFSGPRKGP